ncbi:hypothetical protein MAM1_1251d11537 [Mucor ambiguus]|uniref:Uncharacterized protein n=1 Tax=Mucor ambiguus TaxID=91626 RepID=A0A0C9N746_9FUNG|nr:hypothetical protein MAM1_1251d11537 [Mucor ambiguus]
MMFLLGADCCCRCFRSLAVLVMLFWCFGAIYCCCRYCLLAVLVMLSLGARGYCCCFRFLAVLVMFSLGDVFSWWCSPLLLMLHTCYPGVLVLSIAIAVVAHHLLSW